MGTSINRRKFISKSIKTTAGIPLGTTLLNLSACSKTERHLPNLVKLYYIASNTQSEWSGACFSPDQKILFANIYKKPGMTLAIQRDWQSLRFTT